MPLAPNDSVNFICQLILLTGVNGIYSTTTIHSVGMRLNLCRSNDTMFSIGINPNLNIYLNNTKNVRAVAG